MMLHAIPNPPVVATFAATAGLLGLLANPGVNFSVSTLAQMVGMMLAIGAIPLVYDGIARRVIDRDIGVQSRLRLYPLAIFVAVICLLLSRFLSVSPGCSTGSSSGSRWAARSRVAWSVERTPTSSLALIGAAVLGFPPPQVGVADAACKIRPSGRSSSTPPPRSWSWVASSR